MTLAGPLLRSTCTSAFLCPQRSSAYGSLGFSQTLKGCGTPMVLSGQTDALKGAWFFGGLWCIVAVGEPMRFQPWDSYTSTCCLSISMRKYKASNAL